MIVKVYLHEVCNGEISMIFQSREFGWLEYLDDDKTPFLIHESKAGLINSGYAHHKDPDDAFHKYSKLTYLGRL